MVTYMGNDRLIVVSPCSISISKTESSHHHPHLDVISSGLKPGMSFDTILEN